jgi:hypothetical protein
MRGLFVWGAALLLVGVSACKDDGGSESEASGSEGGTTTGGVDGWHTVLDVDAEDGALMSVWGASEDDVYAVGGQRDDDSSTGVVYHFDGSDWNREDPQSPMLNWVFGVDGEVFAVGNAGAAVRRTDDAWVSEQTGEDRTIWGLWGASLDELWAVGGNGTSDEPLLLRRGVDETWESIELPTLSVEANGLFKVWGTAADDVWVVGDKGATVHYDGTDWVAHETNSLADLIAVWGSAEQGIVAAGGRSNARIARWDGTAWTGETVPEAGLNGVWIDPGEGVTVVGGNGLVLELDDGFGYEVQETDTFLLLHAVFGFAGGPRYAVGGSILSPPPFVGIVLRHD